MRNKKLIVLFFTIVIFLVATNLFTGIKLTKYRNMKKKPPLIEKIYANIGREVNYDNPIVFTGNSMIHRMNWNYIFRKVSTTKSKQIPIIINRGIGGNKTHDLKRRLQSNILELNPRAIFIEIGTNDLIKVTKNNQNDVIHSLVTNYKEITKKILNHSKSIQIYVISILPVLNNEIRNQTAIRINNELRKYSSNKKDIHFIDCFNEFTENNKISAKPTLMIGPWTAHLNDSGYEKWANILLPYVLEIDDNYDRNN